MTGLKSTVIGLIASALLSMAITVFIPEDGIGAIKWIPFGAAAIIYGAMTFLSFKKVHPILIIVISAVIGIGLGYAGVI